MAISHVLFRSAYIVDVEAVCRKAKAVGALVSLDGFHAVGVMPVDVKRLGVEFYSGGVLKWLCGGPGGCFLYASPEHTAHLRPAFTGWQAHERPFGFEETMDYAPNAWRWLNGTPPIPALYAATEGPRIIRRAGIERIREKSTRQTQRLIELADDRGYAVRAPRASKDRGGTVAIDVPHDRCPLDRCRCATSSCPPRTELESWRVEKLKSQSRHTPTFQLSNSSTRHAPCTISRSQPRILPNSPAPLVAWTGFGPPWRTPYCTRPTAVA